MDDPTTQAGVGVSVDAEANAFALSNGYVCLVVEPGKITEASADHTGAGGYGNNVLASNGVTFQREDADGSVSSSASNTAATVQVVVSQNTSTFVEVSMVGVRDGPSPVASEDWTFSVQKGTRRVTFERHGRLTVPVAASMRSLRRQWDLVPSSVYGWYSDSEGAQSVVQMKAAPPGANFFPSADGLLRAYALGGAGDEAGQVGNASIDLLFSSPSSSGLDATSSVLLSSDSGDPYWSGVQEVLAGGSLDDDAWVDRWGSGWDGVGETTVEPGASWFSTVDVFINDLDFPAGAITGNAADIPTADLHSLLMGIYASPAGCLQTHKNAVSDGVSVGQMSTTIARPDFGYSGTYK